MNVRAATGSGLVVRRGVTVVVAVACGAWLVVSLVVGLALGRALRRADVTAADAETLLPEPCTELPRPREPSTSR